MKTIYEKEIHQYFHSVIGFVFLAIFVMVSGYYFLVSNILSGSGDIADYFQNMIQILIFLMPLLTMRSFSEEKRQKTEILLYTKPVSGAGIVAGKFFAAMTVFLIGLAVTAAFPAILSSFGNHQMALTIGCFVGTILLMGVFIAIGIFVSSLTENQIVAAVGTYLIIFLVWYSYGFGSSMQNQAILKLLNRISLMNLYYQLVMGIFDPAGILVMISVIFGFLFLTCVAADRHTPKKHLFPYGILVLLVVVSMNMFVTSVVNRFGWTADLTEGQLFRLTETTRDVLRELEDAVTITYFDEEDGSDTNVSELLKQYQKNSPYVTLRFLDPKANPGVVSAYEEEGVTARQNDIVIEAGDNITGITWSDLYTYNTYTDGNGNTRYNMTAFKAEKKITSAIVQVVSSEATTVLLTDGHNENNTQELIELMEDSHYRVQRGVPGVDGISEDTDTVMIAGPTRDFTADEISLLADFLAEGGSLIVYRNPRAGELPNLDGLLAEWGLRADGTLVMEPSRQMGSPVNVIPGFAAHMINVYFSEASAYLMLPGCGSLQLSAPNGRLTSPVLTSSGSAYGKYLENATTTEKEDGDLNGPFVLAATSEQIGKDENGQPMTSYVFLADCSNFYDKQYLQNASLGNGQLVLQTLAYMNENNVTLDIPEKTLGNAQIAVSWNVTLAIGIIFLGAIPGLLILLGLIIFIRRRSA